jgi:hypothetical protein
MDNLPYGFGHFPVDRLLSHERGVKEPAGVSIFHGKAGVKSVDHLSLLRDDPIA